MFETDDFKIDELGIQLLRNRFSYKNIDFEEIKTLKFKHGPQTKYPIRTLLFGLALIITPNLFWYLSGPINIQFPTNHPRVQLAGIIAYFFVILMGLVAIYLVISRAKILVIELNDGSSEILQLKKFKKENRIQELIEFFKGRITSNGRIELNS